MSRASGLQRLDPRRLLASALVYRFAQLLIRGARPYRQIADRYLRPEPGQRVLDVGCGPADFLAYLPEVDYIGLDQSERYIEAARERFGDRGRFLCQPLDGTRVEALGAGSFDLVFANGLLHHLDDEEALAFFELARAALLPAGRVVTIDGAFTPDQSPVARALLARDRGRFVRSPEAYVELARQVYSNVEVKVHHDLLRIPYTLAVLECSA